MEQSGFYVSVNNNTQLPLHKYEGVFIPTGYASKIAIQKTYYYQLDWPYNDCRKDTSTYTSDDSVYYITTVNATKYSQKLCFDICLQYQFIIPGCNCSDPSIPVIDTTSYSVCSSWTQITCLNTIKDEFNSIDLSLTCDQYCPLECDSQLFDYLISSANYPTQTYFAIVSQQTNVKKKFGSNTLSQTTFGQSCALVNVYLSEMAYTEIDESASITIEGVFGTIGNSGF